MSKTNMEDWAECELGEVVNIQTGKHDASHSTQNGKYRFYTCAFEHLKCDTKEFSGKCIILPGNGANVGEVFFYDGEFDAYQRTYVLNKIKINPKYVFYHLKGFWKLLNIDKQFGTATNYIRMMNFTNYKLPVCSIAEQNAIVKKIEALFSSLDSGIEDLKQAQDKLKLYRQAVLKKAFEGELTKEWRKKNNIEFDWEEKELNQISTINPLPNKKGMKKNIKIQFLPMKLVEELSNKINLSQIRNLSEVQGKSYTYFEENDILFAKVTPCMENGKIAIARNLKNGKGYGSSEFHVIRAENKLDNEYLFYFLIRDEFRSEAKHSMTGAVGLRRVPKKFIEDYFIPLPSIKEQAQIVKEIEKQLSVCESLEKSIEESLEQAEFLRQSILKKAFNGELLSDTEIQLCRQDKDYIPAKELLMEIKRKKDGKSKQTKKISTDIHAGLIAKIIKKHEENPKYLDRLSHVKCEKISHLVEADIQVQLGRNPVKDAAGPDDYPHLKKVEHRAKMAGYFYSKKTKIGHTYRSSKNIELAINKFEGEITKEQKEKIDRLIEIFLPFDLESSEIIATLYAGWNNLLLDGKNPNDEEIVYESRENWSKRKLSIKKERFYKALDWMRSDKVQLIPRGDGNKVLKPKRK